MERAGNTKTLSTQLDVTESDFNREGQGIRVNLALRDELVRRTIMISTATEIYPRNINSPLIGIPES